MNTRYLYIMGADSAVGKSTVCVGILAQLLAAGYLPQQLAYIKPMTQCIEKQAVAYFCATNDIACIDIGSLVFQNRFTRDFIDGITQSIDELRATMLQSILTIGRDKAIVLIDGVGSPSVGSVVGVANIDIASLLPCRIIFVGKSGIGAAIDNTVLNISFIQRQYKQNIGLIYNQIPLVALSETQYYVGKRIVQLLPNTSPLGFIAHNQELALLLQESSETIAAWFSVYVNQHYLLNNWFKLDK